MLHTQWAIHAGHDGEHEDYLGELMEAWDADSFEEKGGLLYLYRNGEYVTTFERRRR